MLISLDRNRRRTGPAGQVFPRDNWEKGLDSYGREDYAFTDSQTDRQTDR